MKTIFTILILSVSVFFSQAQNPVSWSFNAKKTGDKTYEVVLTATIQKGWHLYSQTQPEDAIAIPTEIIFNKNPLVTAEGKIKELGKLEKFHDKTLDVTANQYSNKVDFVQVVKLRGNAKTNISGTVEFQTCNDEKCLPPKKINFNLSLN
jgi:thiol:disulfide interchange protein DsbD